jgi:type IV secretory pathway component VirB8
MATTPNDEDRRQLRRRQQRAKNLAVAFALLALVTLFYLITLVKLGGSA